jgi:lipid kinase YegS
MVMIILNGKKAGIPSVRDAIATLRKEVKQVEVRVTYEYGDVKRFMIEAVQLGVARLIIGGGDGSVNEIVDALATLPREERPTLGILPLGTANDFATACEIPLESLTALRFAVFGTSTSVDIGKANERHFMNMATAGFGAQVTAETPVELKNFLGGGAYTLTGVLKAMNFVPYHSNITTPHNSLHSLHIVAGAVCNGKQAGGGQVLAPNALINDGLLDVISISEFTLADIPQVLDEIKNPSDQGKFIKYIQTPWLESESKQIIPVNLDGEPYSSHKIRFEIVPEAIDLVLPKDSPCLQQK